MTQTLCPGGRRLQALLEEGEAGDEADELVHHLESCSACQETLQDLAAPPHLWVCAAWGLTDKARAEPALHRLVWRLKEEDPLPAEDGGPSFLRPTDKPGLLGLLGRYEVQEEIGRGGMGLVLKALDPDLNRIVAIKLLSPHLASNATARLRFVREAKATAAVCHDHVVTVHGVDATDGLPYLVMQYVDGESLQARLDRTGPLVVKEVVRFGLQTATGLAAAHAQGLIHRDIKPANLLLENGLARVKITDFGLASMADDVGLTQDGVVAGTPEYMAPEQARGEAVDHRADLFSLGSVLYACCTGVPPFRGSTALAVLSCVSEKEPASIRSFNPEVPAWLEAFIARLMAKDPAQRFPSAAEVVQLLEGYLAHLRQPITVPAPEVPSSPGDTLEKSAHLSWPRFAHRLPLRAWLSTLAVRVVRGRTARKGAKFSAWIIGLAVILGLVLVLLGIWACWPSKSAPSSFLDVALGHQYVPGVEESGFYHDEENDLGPFRWTDGRGRLVIPLDKRKLPQALFVQLQRPRNSWLRITVNNQELVNEKARDVDMDFWERTLDLSGIDLGEKLVVEIVSDTVVPHVQQPDKSDDTRALGVTVRAIKMLSQVGKEETAPAGNAFLDVNLGHRFVPGVENSGFYHDERDKEGWFLWTNGKGELVIPLDKTAPLPQALWVRLDRQRNSFLQITVNQQVLVNEPANNGMRRWERTLALSGIDLGENLVVEIVSGTSVLEKDPREIGVKVRGIKLLREIGGEKLSAELTEPRP
jgi:hypothetical protein